MVQGWKKVRKLIAMGWMTQIASMRVRLMEFEAKEVVWSQTMEHIIKTLLSTTKELEDPQTIHNQAMYDHDQMTELHTAIKAELKFRTKACKQAQKACPMMMDKIDALQTENTRQAADLAELRENNERLSRVLDACPLLDDD